MLRQALAIARNTFLESIRQPVFFILLLASGILQFANNKLSTFSLGLSETTEVDQDDKFLLDIGLATVLVLATILASFIATAVVSEEIENRTALTVISKPVGRPLFILGKYLGVAGAMLVATATMLLFFLYSIEHGVMTAAWDEVNWPVVTFSLGAVAVSILLAVWGNFFYGWVFSSTASLILLPLLAVGFVITIFLGHDWSLVQEFDAQVLKPQVMIASAAVLFSMLVLTAIAVAASARLGQVMTIIVVLAVFLFSLLSNYLVGRYAFDNAPVAAITAAEPVQDRDNDFSDANDRWRITLDQEPGVRLTQGDAIYYGADPGGVSMFTPRQQRFEGDFSRTQDVTRPETGPAVVIASIENFRNIELLNVGGLDVSRPPRADDYIFTRPTRINWFARAVWSVVPNVQFFWLVDAVTQGHPVTWRYLALLAGYTVAQVTALLALAVALFQRREVG